MKRALHGEEGNVGRKERRMAVEGGEKVRASATFRGVTWVRPVNHT